MLKFTTKSVIFLALLSALFSFAKFDHCRNSGWATPDVYVHACYSDLPALFGDRGLITHSWPYSSSTNAVEYPPGTAMVMWATSWLVPNPRSGYTRYFDINAALIALLFVGAVLLVAKMNPRFWYLLPLSPAVVASLYINWDLWAVISAVSAIYYFDRKQYDLSALILGVSIATKFYPIVLLLPVVLIFYRNREVKKLLRYSLYSLGTWLILNLPFIVTTPTGWWRFFKLNSNRGADFGSLWFGLNLFGVRLSNLNYFATISFLVGAAAFTYYFFLLKKSPTLAQVAFFIVVIFTSTSKVYSPQYVLWLTPLAILAMPHSYRGLLLRRDFWIWQAGEGIYHLAVWEYLAQYTQSHFGLPEKAYALSIFIRLATTFWFAARLIQASSTRELTPQDLEFLSNESGGYA